METVSHGLVYSGKQVLQGNASRLRKVLRILGAAGLTCAAVRPAGAPLAPLGVCEVLRDLARLEGKAIPVVGRYSYRENGRWMSEQACDTPAPAPPELWLLESSADGPMPPRDYEIDAVVLKRKRIEMERRTSLGKFRFGTPDYDRWAIVYGRVEARKADDAKIAPANLVFRGSGAVLILPAEP